MKVFYSASYCATTIAWDTTRKARFIAESLGEQPIDGVELLEPETATDAELSSVLDPSYLDALRTGVPLALAASNTLGWDESLWDAVSASSGGVRDAVLSALNTRQHAGSLSSGLHHARPSGGDGFCTVNGLALGASAALQHGARRVLVLDLDAHAGGGTAAYIGSGLLRGVEQVDVSVSAYDSYWGIDGATLLMSSGETYLDDVERALLGIPDPKSVDVVLFNAGMDPHGRAGGVRGVTNSVLAARERLVFDWAASHDLPVAWVLAGGYSTGISMDELVDLHRLTIEAASGLVTTD